MYDRDCCIHQSVGMEKIRPLWRHYYPSTQALIFVVDSNDCEKLETASLELNNVLREPELADVPLLVLANKQDLPGALSITQITDRMGLRYIRPRPWCILPACAISGEGLYEGLDWICGNF